jgi:hypothetical protein
MLIGQATWGDVVAGYYSGYGAWLHWSSLITYALVFYYTSKHFSDIDIKGTLNSVLSLCVTWLSIGVFEVYWMWCYATFQNQAWVITWVMPQARILVQNTMFLIIGVFGLLYMWGMGFIWQPRHRVPILFFFSVLFSLSWVYYPFMVPSLTVGNWTNTNLFPQTLYTVLNDPHPEVNAGVAYWVQGDLIHFYNVVVKALMAWLVLEVGRSWRRS